MVAGWQFFVFMENGDGFIAQRWCWRVVEPDGVSVTADKGFTTLTACRGDAANHGFTSNDKLTIDCRGTDRYGRQYVPRFGERRETSNSGFE
jgi:hypothetical protein